MHKTATVKFHTLLTHVWVKAAGILRGKDIQPLSYQKKMRHGWGRRLKKQSR